MSKGARSVSMDRDGHVVLYGGPSCNNLGAVSSLFINSPISTERRSKGRATMICSTLINFHGRSLSETYYTGFNLFYQD